MSDHDHNDHDHRAADDDHHDDDHHDDHSRTRHHEHKYHLNDFDRAANLFVNVINGRPDNLTCNNDHCHAHHIIVTTDFDQLARDVYLIDTTYNWAINNRDPLDRPNYIALIHAASNR